MRFLALFAAVAALVVAPAAMAAPNNAEPSRLAGGQVTKLHLHVEGIACDACSKRLREAMTKLDGVVAVEVDRVRADLAVDFDASKTTEQAIRAEVTKHGFTVK